MQFRRACKDGVTMSGRNYFWKDFYFYGKHCKAIKVKVLPKICTRGLMHIAHAVLLPGHLGRKKTTSRVLSIFY